MLNHETEELNNFFQNTLWNTKRANTDKLNQERAQLNILNLKVSNEKLPNTHGNTSSAKTDKVNLETLKLNILNQTFQTKNLKHLESPTKLTQTS